MTKGIYLDYSEKKGRKLYISNKSKIVRFFKGYNYYKQLCTNPYLVQFIYALTFDK